MVFADRVLKRLAMARARVGLLQRRLRRGEALDPREAEAHLADVDQAVDEAAKLVRDVRGDIDEPSAAGPGSWQESPHPSPPPSKRLFLRRPADEDRKPETDLDRA